MEKALLGLGLDGIPKIEAGCQAFFDAGVVGGFRCLGRKEEGQARVRKNRPYNAEPCVPGRLKVRVSA